MIVVSRLTPKAKSARFQIHLVIPSARSQVSVSVVTIPQTQSQASHGEGPPTMKLLITTLIVACCAYCLRSNGIGQAQAVRWIAGDQPRPPPLSPAIVAGNFVCLGPGNGPKTGEFAGALRKNSEPCGRGVLEASGSDLNHVVKLRCLATWMTSAR